MCSSQTANLIVEVLSEKMNNNEIFTAFDVTKEVRSRTSETVLHRDVRRILSNYLSIGYNKELCVLNVSGNPQAFVYYPDSKSFNDYPLVLKDDEEDNDETDEDNEEDIVSINIDGRVNVPKKVLKSINPVGGSYDILVNGSLISKKPNSDGRVRFSTKDSGITTSKVKIIVDSNKNVIEVESI